MKKKIFAAFLTLCVSFTCIHPIYAETSYSGYLSELKDLLNQCEQRGIDTNYERINYAVIQKFESYLNEDEQQGGASSQLTYNREQIDALYTEAKENLQNYLDGKKTPFGVTEYDMNSVNQKNQRLVTSGGQSVYSVGYMGWGPVADDINSFPDFGTNNIMLEAGPTSVTSGVEGWEITDINKTKSSIVTGSNLVTDGNRSLRVSVSSADSWSFVMQTIACKPNTTYEFGLDCKGSGIKSVTLNINDRIQMNLDTGSQWTSNKRTFRTNSDEQFITLNILTYGPTSLLYIDNASLKEVGTDENLLINGSFENDTDYANAAYWKRTLERAKQYGIGVSLLLSPAYIPQDLPEEVYGDWRAAYNVDAPETREVIENYLRTILPHFQNLPALTSICLSNEPRYDTRVFEEFYTPKFREYLKSVHGDIATLNSKYGTKYTSFDEVTMPLADSNNNSPQTPQFYDWMEFNDKTFSDWHRWMAGIVKEYLPDVPVHAKVLHYLFPWSGDGLETLTRGTDIEQFNEFCDWAGNDLCDYTTNTEMYYTVMMTYDYLNSMSNKPIYNSEDHIIPDHHETFDETERKHLRNNLWQGAIHGRDVSSIWVWERSYDSNVDMHNSIKHRPDCVAEAGKTALDLNRLSEYVAALDEKEPDVALFYSKPSQVYDNGARVRLWQTYRNLISCGLRVGIVSDKSIESLSKYKTLVIPRAYNCKQETLTAVNEFIKNGGKVFMQSGSFVRDEYNKTLDNSYLKNNSESFFVWSGSTAFSDFQKYFEKNGMLDVKVCKADGTIPEGIEWETAEKNGHLIVNITSIPSDTNNLHVEKNGEILTGAVDLLTQKSVSETFTAERYVPMLLKFGGRDVGETPVITSLWSENGVLRWENDGDAYGAKIYRITSDGLEYDGKTAVNSYAVQNETVFVRPMDYRDIECGGSVLSVFNNKPIQVSVEDVKDGEAGVSYTLSLKNTASVPVKCITAVGFSDGEKTSDSAYVDVMLKAGENSKIRMHTEKQGDILTAVVWDSLKTKNDLSQKIEYNLTSKADETQEIQEIQK